MIFTELRFLGFFLVVFALHWGISSLRGRHLILLAASYVFYGAWDIRFLGLIILSTAVDFAAGCVLAHYSEPRKRRLALACSIVLNLGLLGVFKYYNFFAESFATRLRSHGFEAGHVTLNIVLPVGISFYTFQSISYIVDVYRQTLQPTKNPITYALFVAFFPQLVAGPIVRASDFLPQLAEPRRLDLVAWRPLLLLFLSGYIKKAVVSDNFAPYVDAFFAQPATFDTAAHWLGVLAYAAQIYCDFSGYSDMAIATAGLLGYHLCQNFNSPYLAGSPRDFWRRWHMSLSTWLRDYLYIPLGGNRGSPRRASLNLLATMLLGGLWHGAAWTFVFWGALHGLALMVDRLWRQFFPLRSGELAPPRRMLGWLVTMLVVLVGWVFFRAADFPTALSVIAGAVGGSSGTMSLPGVLWIYLGACLAIHWWSARDRSEPVLLLHLSWPAFSVVYGVMAGFALVLVNTGYRAFIYFQF
jgi:alginate O-acetyltransferase complex protein AlgI